MTTPLSATITLTFDPTRPGEAGAVLDDFSSLLMELQKRGGPVTVMSPTPGPDVPGDEPPPLDPMMGDAGDARADQEPPRAAQSPVKRVRDRTAERRAAREKAEAEARAKAQADPDDPLMGAAGAGNVGGDPFGDDPLPPGPDPKPKANDPEDRVRTPKQCMDGSIVILRQCFAVPGGADAVKALQKTYKISKFIDLPMDSAPGLWKDAVALAGRLNVTIPAGV